MNIDTLLIIGTLILGFSLLIYWLQHQLAKSQSDTTLIEWVKNTSDQLQSLQHTMTATLQKSDKNVTDTLQQSYQQLNERLDVAAKVIGELRDETGKFSEIGRSMKDLQDFLRSPKLRGNVGEQVLADLLKQMLPPASISLQYRFESGDIVDAIIKTQAGLIPIDAKFPMENFTRIHQTEEAADKTRFQKAFVTDVKKHIKAISTKYVQPSKGTVDFALMYIPSEAVYYEMTAESPELAEYAQQSRVLMVSPATFYAFLRTILVSFEGQRIAQEARQLLGSLREIQHVSKQFGEHLDVLSRHITNAHKNMGEISTEFSQLHTKIDATQALSAGINDKPQLP